MKRNGKKLVLALVLFLQVYFVHADKIVTVTGISSEYLDAYYEGVAKVVEAAAKIQFVSNVKNKNSNDMAVFLAGNALNPIASIIGLPNSDDKLKAYKEGVVQAAQVYSIGRKQPCMSPSSSLNRKDVEKAINMKFEGPFENEHLGVLVVGALEAFSEQYPCD